MSSFENERDPDILRQIARLMQSENERLHKRLAELSAELAALKGQKAPEQLGLELSSLQEQLGRMQAKLYGASSEKREHAPAEPSATPPRPQRGHGPTKQPRLEVEPELITIPDEECVCKGCGGDLEAIEGATEDSELITVVERKFVMKQIARQKYRCDCGIGVTTAPAPLKLIAGGRYSIDFAIHVAVQKYCLHQPLERQRRAMSWQGLTVTTQTLWDQLDMLAKPWMPVNELLRLYILGGDVVGADETWWRLMEGPGSKRWWAWSLRCPNAVYYRIAPSRSAAMAASLLEGFTGTIVCDAYKAYETLAKRNTDIRLALCWAHARRYFVEAEPTYPVCREALELIGNLFAIDRDTLDPARLEGDAKLEAADARLRARAERAPPLLEQLRTWACEQRGLPKSGLRKAVDYLLGHWQGLTVFVQDPFVPMHNNATEQTMRTPVLGRNNHYGSRSQRGTEVAALFYSILETATLNGLDPAAYMHSATPALLRGAPPEAVLPFDFEPSRLLVPRG